MEYINSFLENSLHDRTEYSRELRERYKGTDLLPVIIDRFDKKTPMLKRHRWLCSGVSEVRRLLFEIRKELSPETGNSSQTYLLFARKAKNAVMLLPSATIMEVYAQHVDPDGFLYLFLQGENAFG